MVAASECWKKKPNSQAHIAAVKRALMEAVFDVECMTAAVGELIIPCTQGGTLVGRGGIVHILTALGEALNCADHESGDTECVGLSDVEEAVNNFETERYLADNWECNETLMENIRRVKEVLDCAQSRIFFRDLVAGCRTLCTDYRQTKWVVARAITEPNIPITEDMSCTNLLIAIRRSRFGNVALSFSSGIQRYVIIDTPLYNTEDVTMLIPWMQVTDTGQILCGSRVDGWYVKWTRSLMYRGLKIPEFSEVSQEEAVAIVTFGKT